MRINELLLNITDEISSCLADLKEDQLEALEKEIKASDRIFVAGAGRSLLMIKAVAMRLMHMGFDAYVVGETITPAIGEKDLLLIASGSGTTATLKVVAEKGKKAGAKLALITTNPDSPIGNLADLYVQVIAATTKDIESAARSIQPGANTFEQSVLLIGDAIVLDIISGEKLDEKNEELMKRHANLE